MTNDFKNLIDEIHSNKEEAIKSALPEGMLLSEIPKRCVIKRRQGETYETLYVDGEPRVTFKDYEVSHREDGGRVVLRIEQQVKFHI